MVPQVPSQEQSSAGLPHLKRLPIHEMINENILDQFDLPFAKKETKGIIIIISGPV